MRYFVLCLLFCMLIGCKDSDPAAPGDGGNPGDDSSIPIDSGYGPRSLVSIVAGNNHTCGQKSNYDMLCWGKNTTGQLGNGMMNSTNTAAGAMVIAGVRRMAAGGDFNCASSDAPHKCWGENEDGQLGDDTTADKVSPTNVKGSINTHRAAAGSRHACAVKTGVPSGHGIVCWGANNKGQLGNGSTNPSDEPVDAGTHASLANASDVSEIAAGGDSTCVLTGSHTVLCWGAIVSNANTPTLIAGFTGPEQVNMLTVANDFACARMSDNTVRCWGVNNYGQLGNGSSSASSMPVTVAGLTNVESLATGSHNHMCAVRTDHTVRCWGRNDAGQLGNGNTTDSNTPVAVMSLIPNVATVAGGAQHTCASLNVSGVFCWGRNQEGQLGDGSTTDSLTPVKVLGL